MGKKLTFSEMTKLIDGIAAEADRKRREERLQEAIEFLRNDDCDLILRTYKSPSNGYPYSPEGIEHLEQLLFTAAREGDSALHEQAALTIRRLRELVQKIDSVLRVPAAEYIPAIQDAFNLIDRNFRA